MTTESSWHQTTLGEALGAQEALQTGPFGSQLRAADYVSSGVPVIMPKDLLGGSICWRKAARVSARKARELPKHQLRTGDVILARRGEMGRCAGISAREEGWICGTGCLRIRPCGPIDGGFLVHFLRWSATCNWLGSHAVGQTLPSLSTRILSSLPLRIPPKHEQRNIARVLDAADQTVAASRRLIGQIERVQQSFFRQILTCGSALCFPDLPGDLLDPASWEQRSIRSLCRMSNGHAFRTRDRATKGWPIIRIQNLNGSREFNYFGGFPAPRWMVERGDLLFAWAGVKGSSFGPCLWEGPKGVLNQHIFRVEPYEGVVKEWLYEALRIVTNGIVEQAQGFKTTLQHVRKSDIVDYRVPMPPFEVQHWIGDKSKSLARLARLELASLERLLRIKQGLADDLLSGLVRTV